jgi:hypothetical protein
MDISINLNKLEVQLVGYSSGIFSGETSQYHWRAQVKSNTGLVVSGNNNRSEKSINMVHDPDFVDISSPPAEQKLLERRYMESNV